MRHTFASLLLLDGAPIAHVSRQLGHKVASLTLRVYAHCAGRDEREAVDLLDGTQLSATQTQPERRVRQPLCAFERMVTLTFTSWNLIGGLLRRIEALHQAA